ncbi:MAG: hypothetical protein J5992_06565 [Oscillospiraceae bacterium]|nr:hypothetical protein [Oscillospiraceae bacterium]
MDTISFLGTDWSVYEMFCFFAIYSVIGWFVETIYMTLETGYFDNRGFLNGPICPIYGFGMVFVLIALTPLVENAVLLFVGSVILTTSWEFLIGFSLEKIFHNTWWDYSHEKFNLKGYICLKNSLLWGIACVLVMNVVHPALEKFVDFVPVKIGLPIAWCIFILIMVDLGLSIAVIINLNNRLQKLDELRRRFRMASDAIGENLSDEVLELKAKYDRLSEKTTVWQKRVLRAFPRMRSHEYNIVLSDLRERFDIRKKLKNIKK